MRPTVLLVPVTLCIALLGFGAKKPPTLLTVRAVTHASRVNQYTSTYTTPGTSNTNCGGSATSMGNTTIGSANCQTTSMPAQVHQTTRQTVDVTDLVEANGNVYAVTCRANWVGSNCAPMIDGEEFPAEIDGDTMWITAHKGGNQGKEVRTKYKILDIRAVPPVAPVTAVSDLKPGASTLTNADVLALRDAGISDQIIVEKIRSSQVKFDLDTPDLVALKNAGLDDAVTAAMLEASRR